jgi:hypothetical protein
LPGPGRRARRGRPPRNLAFLNSLAPYNPLHPPLAADGTPLDPSLFSQYGPPKNSYYASIKYATSGQFLIDRDSLVDTIAFTDFNFLSSSRDELIHIFKSIAAKKGFKAIIPFTDRNNRMSTSSTFCCSLAG